jgi:hypothetical protein
VEWLGIEEVLEWRMSVFACLKWLGMEEVGFGPARKKKKKERECQKNSKRAGG